ncbi:MAG TPA: hypothetical protein VHX38_23790 [Pseudonocardiaceae bacterium]|jgi:hypothetical protein|nr:hypothetical protein [Pseudonocardiaceae bacterium]
MGWDITAITLASIGLAAVVVTLYIALADILDPGTVSQCQECHRLTLNSPARSAPMCYRCRHDHRGHFAVGMTRLHISH